MTIEPCSRHSLPPRRRLVDASYADGNLANTQIAYIFALYTCAPSPPPPPPHLKYAFLAARATFSI